MTVQAHPETAHGGTRRLEGRVALVTGGTRGIGAAIGRRLAFEGAVIAAGYSSDRERAEEFMGELEDRGTTVTLHQGNVGHVEHCERVVEEVIERHGRLDILVNNAETEMLATVPEKVLERIKGQIPMRRLGQPEEVARLVEFLCQDESAYITGQVLAVNGGMEM